MPHKESKWFISGVEGVEVSGTRGRSKDEATDKFCEQMDMLDGIHHDWVYWSKRGYKLRKNLGVGKVVGEFVDNTDPCVVKIESDEQPKEADNAIADDNQ